MKIFNSASGITLAFFVIATSAGYTAAADQKVSKAAPVAAQKEIILTNIPLTATEHDVRAALAAYGPVVNVKVMMNKETGLSRRAATVTMSRAVDAQAAVEALDNSEWLGSNIKVALKRN